LKALILGDAGEASKLRRSPAPIFARNAWLPARIDRETSGIIRTPDGDCVGRRLK
jgi:hypothetical protein